MIESTRITLQVPVYDFLPIFKLLRLSLAVVRRTEVYLLDFFALVFSFTYTGVLIFALSPFYILIYDALIS